MKIDILKNHKSIKSPCLFELPEMDTGTIKKYYQKIQLIPEVFLRQPFCTMNQAISYLFLYVYETDDGDAYRQICSCDESRRLVLKRPELVKDRHEMEKADKLGW